MIFRVLALALGIHCCLVVPLSTPALAQDVEKGAHLEGLVFEQGSGTPLEGILLGIDDHEPFPSGAQGRFSLELAPGAHLPYVQFRSGKRIDLPPVNCAVDRVTELIITVDATQERAFSQQEEPEGIITSSHAKALGPPGRIVGQIIDEEGSALGGARIYVRGSKQSAKTDRNGYFRLELPPNTYDLSILQDRFVPGTAQQVLVNSDQETSLQLMLVEAGVDLSDFTITAPRVEGSTAGLLDEKKDSTALTEVMGSEQMARSGASNAAAALKRVTGLTVVGGKYVYVRGLGERYSSAQLNGSSLPSPEPERRVVPLDLFGASVLQSVVIQKTYSPDMPGEFGGGSIILRTRQYPDSPLLKTSISLGYESGTTFQQGLVGPRGPMDFLGVGSGFRALQSPLAEAISDGNQIVPQSVLGGYTEGELMAFGQSINNRWNVGTQTLPSNISLGVTKGNKWATNGGEHGYLLSLTYSNKWDNDIYTRTNYGLSGGELTPNYSYDFQDTKNAIRLGGLFNYGITFNERHELKLTTTLSRNSDSQARIYTGEDPEGVTLEVYRSRWVEQQLLLQQVAGQHTLGKGDIGLNWRYTAASAKRIEPDRRDWRYDLEWVDADETSYECDVYDEQDSSRCGVWLFSNSPDNNQIFYNALNDINHDFGSDLTLPFQLGGDKNRSGKVQIGGVVMYKGRDSSNRRLYYGVDSSSSSIMPDDWRTYSVDEIFSAPYIDPDGVQLQDATQTTDTYNASQRLGAAYAMVDLPITEGLMLSGGLRVEQATLQVSTTNPFDISGGEVASGLQTRDLLPSLNGTQKMGRRMQLRAAYGRTLSRPDFREMSELTFYDVAGDFATQGNPDLSWVKIDNYDLRWEFYPTEGETLSVAGFYKKFHDPIEAVAQAGAEPILSFENAVVASNFGIEFDARLYLDLIEEKLANFYIAGNVSIIRSQITLLPEQAQILTSLERPLQGQSPYVANAQLGYDNEDWGTNSTLLYNVYGPRISTVGVSGAPDIYEQPVHQLDLVFSQTLKGGFKVSAKASNLLNSAFKRSQADELTLERYDGRSISLGLSWTQPGADKGP